MIEAEGGNLRADGARKRVDGATVGRAPERSVGVTMTGARLRQAYGGQTQGQAKEQT